MNPATTLAANPALGFWDYLPTPVVAVLLISAVLWMLLPFAVFGIKSRLDKLIRMQREQLDYLKDPRGPPEG